MYFNLCGQIPQGYYATAEGLSGENLKTALYNIIKGHTEYPYTDSGTDVWDILKESDRDPGNPNNVILLYTGWSVNAAQEYNSGTGWSREHVWAKSRGDFGTDPGPGTDAHHLRPADISVNSARNNRWFDSCTVAYFDGGIATGCYTSSTSWVWQPRAAVKGDVARMIFYMATRYEGENGEPDLEMIDYLPADNYTTEPVHALLKVLLRWNEEDPVDDFERNRNEVVYSYQHNRNPFIDHPEYMARILETATPASLIDEEQAVTIYPNPAYEIVSVDPPGKYLFTLYNLSGSIVLKDEGDHLDVSCVAPGHYILSTSGQTPAAESIHQLIVR
ncbi:MAG: endonuclease [Bacteroidales bacterium]